jgi:hypothetical protein
MEKLLLWIGRLAGLVGIVVCAVAVVVRASGKFTLGNFQVGTMLLAGMAIMLVACLGYLAVLAERPPK